MISHEQNPEYLKWANDVLGVKFEPHSCTWITRLNKEGQITAVAVYNMGTEFNIEMSVASDKSGRCVSREFLAVAYRYPFNQLKLRRVTAIVKDGDSKTLEIARKLGHVYEATLKGWFGDRDGIVMRMLREECKWL